MQELALPILSSDPAILSLFLFPIFLAVTHDRGARRKGYDVQFMNLSGTHTSHHPRPASSSETGTVGVLSLLQTLVGIHTMMLEEYLMPWSGEAIHWRAIPSARSARHDDVYR